MLERASGQFTIEGNVEDIFGGISGATRIARISQTCLFTGAMQGESIAEYTAVLPREGDSSFQGFQRISGTLGEREGTFVVCVTGEYAKGQPRGSWTIVPKSGSGDFVHIRGSGTFSQSAGKAGSYKLEFDLRKPRKSRDAGASTEPEESELIPGIDIVAEDEPALEIKSIVVEPQDENPVEKPVRRPRKKTAPLESVVVESTAAEPEIAPKRSRKKAAPAGGEETVLGPAAAPARTRSRASVEAATDQSAAAQGKNDPPVRKRSRKTETSEIAVETPVDPEPAPKRRRKQSESSVEQPVAESKPSTPPARKRGRKPATDEIAPVTVEPAAKRRRKPVDTPDPTAAEAAPVPQPKPARRKTSPAPPEPTPLPIAQNKPARQRKAKAA